MADEGIVRKEKPEEAFLSKLFLWAFDALAGTFFLWLLLIPLLAPVWGRGLLPVAGKVVQRLEFLLAAGVPLTDSLGFFQRIDTEIVLGVGLLLGTLFFNLPIAMVLSLSESFVRRLRFERGKKIARAIAFLLALLLFAPMILHYAGFNLWSLWAFLLLFLLPPFWFELMEKLRRRAIKGTGLVSLPLSLICFLFIVSPFLTQPAWHLTLHPEKYREFNLMTLVRDWFLLDDEGGGFVNDTYYAYASYMAEHGRVTVFNLPVIGLSGETAVQARTAIERYSVARKGQMAYTEHRRAWVLNYDNPKRLLEDLQTDRIDFAAISLNEAGELSGGELDAVSDDALVILTTRRGDQREWKGKRLMDMEDLRQSWMFEYEEGLGSGSYRFSPTPLLTRLRKLSDAGWQPDSYSDFLLMRGVVLGNLMGGGFRTFLFLALVLVSATAYGNFLFLAGPRFRGVPLLAVLAVLALGVPVTGELKSNLRAWRSLTDSDGVESPEKRMLELRRAEDEPDMERAKRILERGLHGDKRVAMWQISLLGKCAKRADGDLRRQIVDLFRAKAESIQDEPLNFRYKFIEAAAGLRELHPALEQMLKGEQSLYVRWYAEDWGIGLPAYSDRLIRVEEGGEHAE